MPLSVTFISNSLTQHQLPVCEALHKSLGDRFCFISTVPITNERKQMGWTLYNDIPYEIKAYESKSAMEQSLKRISESDAVIIGSATDSYIIQRLISKKLTFRYSERLYKKGLSFKQLPKAIFSSYLHHGRFQKYPIYMLCASAYTAGDHAFFNNYKNRAYKWGYFPEEKKYDIEKLIQSKHSKVVKILWAGRFLDWKHPEQVLSVAEKLSKENIEYQIKMIGNGTEFEHIKSAAGKLNLKKPIEFLGTMPPDEVRKHMEEANIYLFTSDFNEGWGAVLNESMNSGCAVVASHAIGSVPFLVKHNENGLIYKNSDTDDLCDKVISLTNNRGFREALGTNAYLTIKNIWNSEIAAKRFIGLAEGFLSGIEPVFETGPCSKAEIIKNNWFDSVKP